ncbi:SRPBCC domain-containing protein [Aquidulcibacter sp.]|uniref:SRPBCC family protein n=1 Tax=Aquidulcibacter sp. TaxID=2052990 RepID=UPI0025BDD539|nr:SRPBCC domain-containing protein [Aquidulcibacter sp.]MCA3694160.1 SRPBCC domain-containing protein [Aquidulcibacter sp.]
MKDIVISRTLAFPRAMVWAALTSSDHLAAWLMPNDFRPIPNHAFTFKTDPAPGFDGTVHCTVLEIIEPERLKFSWRGGGIDTVVTFELREKGKETQLTLSHAGFAGLSNLIPRVALGFGWKDLLSKKLPAYLSAHFPK